jgi:hypothetical protein
MNVKNLNSAKKENLQVDININCSFMNLSPLSVNWNFDVADQHDAFTISGKPQTFRQVESIRSSGLICM